jgi:peptidoglycan/LPS O-acetylase OafA/YrhL
MSVPVTNFDIMSHLFMIHDFFISSNDRINYVFWSIAVEFRIYLIFPVLVWIWRKSGSFAALTFASLFTLIGTLVLIYLKPYYPDLNLKLSGVCPYILLFTFGMFAAELSFSSSRVAVGIRELYSKLPVRNINFQFILYLVAYAGVSGVLLRTGNMLSESQNFILLEIKDILIGIITAFFLFICTLSTQSGTWAVRFLNWRPLVFIGTFSYSLYLIHGPLLQILDQYILAPLLLTKFTNTCLLLGIGTPLILLTAYLFFLLFERPFLTSGKTSSIKIADSTATNPAP